MTNCMWNVIITLSSVGYGELYPKTFFGRIVGVVICFWGIFIVSFFVVTVTSMLDFSETEEKSYDLLIRLYYKGQLKKEAVDVLSSAFVHRNAKINSPDNSSMILSFKLRHESSEVKIRVIKMSILCRMSSSHSSSMCRNLAKIKTKS